jgi:hypothetical protein
MNEESEHEQILDEAKKLNPEVANSLVLGLGAFLTSDLNKTELNPSSLKQLTEDLLKKLTELVKNNEN